MPLTQKLWPKTDCTRTRGELRFPAQPQKAGSTFGLFPPIPPHADVTLVGGAMVIITLLSPNTIS
jgi:hypothetical protein